MYIRQVSNKVYYRISKTIFHGLVTLLRGWLLWRAPALGRRAGAAAAEIRNYIKH